MQLNFINHDETQFLDPLDEIVERNETLAESLLKLFHTEWKKSVDPIFEHLTY